MTNQTKVEQQKPGPSIIRSLMEPAPTLAFVMRRKQTDGSVTEFPFRCRLLRQEQNMDAMRAAQAYAKERGESERYQDIYSAAQVVELIQRAIVHDTPTEMPDGSKQYLSYFTSAQQVRQSLDEAECAQLMNCYTLTKAYFQFSDLDDDDAVERMIDSLADEAAGTFFLSRVPSHDWPNLIFTLARLARSWRPESSRTSSDSASTSESDPETSGPGTTSFSELPDARSSGSELSGQSGELPTDRYLTREEAIERVKNAPGRDPEEPKEEP